MICPDCNGAGMLLEPQICTQCHGRGWLLGSSDQGGYGGSPRRETVRQPCMLCNQTGHWPPLRRPCPTCRRTGEVRAVPGLVPCPTCGGRGVRELPDGQHASGLPRVRRVACGICGGRGQVRGTRYEPIVP